MSARETQLFIEMVGRNGLDWVLDHAASACRIETEDMVDGPMRDRLWKLAEELEDVAVSL